MENEKAKSDAGKTGNHQMIQHMIAGGIAGSSAKTITAPLSRLTILYQIGHDFLSYNLSTLKSEHPTSSSTLISSSNIQMTAGQLNKTVQSSSVSSGSSGLNTSLLSSDIPFSIARKMSTQTSSNFTASLSTYQANELLRRINMNFVDTTNNCPKSQSIHLNSLSSRPRSVSTGPPGAISVTGRVPMIAALRSICRKEGVCSLWKGNLTSVIHRFPYSAINFSVYDTSKRWLVSRRSISAKETAIERFLCGALGGAMACAACYPLDLIRTRLTADTSTGSLNQTSRGFSRGIIESLLDIVRREGVKGLYRGLLISMAVSVPNLAVGFSCYGTIKEFLITHSNHHSLLSGSREFFRSSSNISSNSNSSSLVSLGAMFVNPVSGELNVAGSLLSGAGSGIAASLLIFPADVVRRRLQVKGVAAMQSSTATPTSALSEATAIFREAGLKGFYRGIAPELLKVIPMVSITFAVYEFCVKLQSDRN